MSENNLSSISNDKEDCEEEENIVTMVDVLKAEESLEENADAVLGPGDDKNCTYNEGYLKRQALYSCLTCFPADGTERAGICLACSYDCHSDHDLVELYTKRNFRCDCGNPLFKGKKCTLDPVKIGVNEKNLYNDNFRGVYCSCKRPYPDPENNEEDTMIQCIICEDWFHTQHLGSGVPNEDEYAEMICAACTDKLPFLQYYLGYAVTKISKDGGKNESAADISITDGNSPQTSPQKQNISAASPEKQAEKNEVNGLEKECLLKNMEMLPRGSGATFWPEGFRKLLCTCTSCLENYSNKGVAFITDEEDTVQAYERKVKPYKAESQYERGMEALSSLDRVQQMEAILNYNEMKTHLSQYLAKFAENKKVVREEDIREFFSGMKDRKRPKLDIPYNCR